MAATHFTGPVITGDLSQGQVNGPNKSYNITEQQIVFTNAAGPVTTNYAMYIPAGSVIQDFLVDVLTAFNSATSALLSIGNVANGTQYVTSVNLAVAGRIAVTYTAPQLAAMNGLTALGAQAPTLPLLNFTVATLGAGVAGVAVVTVRYAQQAIGPSGTPVAPGTPT
jgi:hypothetical protein